jgi:hypothetical protein
MTDLEKKKKKKESNKKYIEKNKEKLNQYSKKWRQENKEYHKEYHKEYQEKNKEKIKELKKKYYQNNKEKNKKIRNIYQTKYFKKRKIIDPLFRLRCNIASLIKSSITNKGFKKKTKTCRILGCSYEEFKQHLERQFLKGMSWENKAEWHLDHIYPVSLAKNEAELIKLNHYTNFQPLWAKDNITKGNKIIANTQIKLI